MDKEKEIKVESLNIKIGGRDIQLSIAEAKKLKSALEDLFGKEVIHEYRDHWYYRQYPYYPNWGTVYYSTGNPQAVVTNASSFCGVADGTVNINIS